MKLLYPLLDFFLPAYCPACHKQTIAGNAACAECMNSLLRVEDARRQAEYEKKFSSLGVVDGFFSAFLFEHDKPIRLLLHSVKYGSNTGLAKLLGRVAGNELRVYTELCSADIIVPVPLHQSKKHERGYNQSERIARGLSPILEVPSIPSVMSRIKATRTQTRLNLTERRENVLGAFKLNKPKTIYGKRVIILDDVITTGATVSECASLLKAGGAERVYAVSVALAK